MLAQLTLSNQQITLSVLAVVATLIGYHFVFRKYIREQAGIVDVTRTELSPNNEVLISTKLQYAPLAEVERLEKYVHVVKHDLANSIQALQFASQNHQEQQTQEMGELRKEIHNGFDRLDGKRSVSTANLHTQLKAAELKLQSVESTVDSNSRAIDRLDGKLDRVVDRVADKIESLLKGKS